MNCIFCKCKTTYTNLIDNKKVSICCCCNQTYIYILQNGLYDNSPWKLFKKIRNKAKEIVMNEK